MLGAQLREGAPLPDTPAAVANTGGALDRDGFSERATPRLARPRGRTLNVDEPDTTHEDRRCRARAARDSRACSVSARGYYNRRAVGRATTSLIDVSLGALSIGQPRRGQPGHPRPETAPDEVVLDRRGTKNVLVVPLRWRTVRSDLTTGSGREDLFSPADGFAPAIGYSTILFDHSNFNHAFIDGYVSYKFGRDDPVLGRLRTPDLPWSGALFSAAKHTTSPRPTISGAHQLRADARVGRIQEQLPRLLPA